jgi:ketosteroid isomerase-like protein
MVEPAQETAETELCAYMAIRRQIDRYMSALDRRDFEAVADCFTEDAAIYMHVIDGNLSDAEFHRGGPSFAKAVRRLDKFHATSHNLANAVIDVDGEQASAVSQVNAWLLGEEADGSRRVIFRSVHVVEDFVLTDRGWKIARRVHSPQMQYEVPAASVQLPYRKG